MNESPKAVFLSYASQDAEAAKRIADALRAAGVEVWFDQNELVGGDAWDQKIRRQIGSCALLLPIISASTQARREGYFRLEWRLAVERMRQMDDDLPFLLPVVIDGTKDAEAFVPERFRETQWTRLPSGETTPAFVARVQKLVDGSSVGGALRPDGSEKSGYKIPPATIPLLNRKVYAVLAVAAFAIAGAAGWWVLRDRGPATPISHPQAPGPNVASADTDLARLRTRIVPDRWQKGDFEAIDSVLERFLRQNPENADAWALRSIICSLQTMRLIDRGTKPLQDGRLAAERAQSLAPGSPLADLALGYHLTANINRGGDPEAGRAPMDRAVAALPPDALTRYGALATAWNAYDLAGTETRAREWLAAEPAASFPAWILASMSVIARQPADVLTWAEKVTSDPNITGVRAFSTMFDANYYLRADLAAAAAVLDRVPPRGRTVPRVVFCRWLLNSAQGRHDDALQALAAVPESFIGDVSFAGPKALLAGFSHRWAGRADPATVQFREAERLLRERLAGDAENEEFRVGLALALAALHREAEARTELALVEPALRGRAPSLYRGQLFSFVSQVYATLGDGAGASYYLRRIFTEPSNPSHTPASLRQDPRFRTVVGTPELQALFDEFSVLNPRPAEPIAAAAPAESVAVLAFANLSDDKANEYFSDGISEELLNVLAKVPGLKVSARTSAFFFKGKEVPIPEIAKQLGVAYVVEGSVRKAGDKVRITAQLIKAADGFHVWSDTFTRDLKDIFAVQDEIAGRIAHTLSDKLGLGLPSLASTRPDAYNLYLQARSNLATRRMSDLQLARQQFESVLALDPGYHPARAGLAKTLAILPTYGRSFDLMRNREIYARAEREARQVLERDPRNAEAWMALGYIYTIFEWRWEEAGEAFARALELAPNDAEVINFAGDYYRAVRDAARMVAMETRALELNPLNPANHWDLAYAHFSLQDYEPALRHARGALALSSDSFDAYYCLIWTLGSLRRFDEMRAALGAARRDLRESEASLLNLEVKAAILEGRTADALRLQDKITPYAERGDYSPGDHGYHYLLLGDSEQAARWLKRAGETHDFALIFAEPIDLNLIAADPRTRFVVELPGVKELVEIRARNGRTVRLK